MGVVWGALTDLFWIFEYITTGLFAVPLSTDCPDVKKIQQRLLAICILDYGSSIDKKVVNCKHMFIWLAEHFFIKCL